MRLLRSFSFRLAAIYAVLFSVSLAVVLSTYQLVSITLPRNEVKEGLEAEYRTLAGTYGGDRHALAQRLESRAGARSSRAGFHLLADPEGRVVSTNLPSWPAYAGPKWQSIEADIYRDGDEDDHEALALDRRLTDGSRLLIGRDVEEIDDLEEAIASAAIYLIAATLIIATLGAFLMNWAVGRRLAAITGAARQVIGGDLAGRVPMNGSGDDFDRLAATLNTMLERVEAGVEAVRTASDSVAHELRTPLTRLQASLRSLAAADKVGSEEAQDALEESNRLQHLFDAILRVSRIESGRHESDFVDIDLALLIADAVDLYTPATDERNVSLSLELEEGLMIVGDRDLVFQAVANLIDNAVKFTPPGGSVRVRTHRQAGSVRLAIQDTGPGIPSSLIARMGERFFRAPETAHAPGYGLGLSLVVAVLNLHRAALKIYARNPGLEVSINFPPDSPATGSTA